MDRIIPTREMIRNIQKLWKFTIVSMDDETALIMFNDPYTAFIFANDMMSTDYYKWDIMLRTVVEDFDTKTTLAVRLEG